MALSERLDMMVQAASGLVFLASKGVIHRYACVLLFGWLRLDWSDGCMCLCLIATLLRATILWISTAR